MDKSLAALIGAVGALAVAGPAHAATSAALQNVMQANSYADLLKPIPNALALRQALAEAPPTEQPAAAEPEVMPVQYYRDRHHHHHHRYRRRHHHHHHHRHGIGLIIR